MGTGWRRAFCTTVSRDPGSDKLEKKKRSSSPSPSPRSCVRLGFLSGGSNSSTPRSQLSPPILSPTLRCRTTSQEAVQTANAKTQRIALGSNPSSPRSPLKLSLFKSSFKFRSSCGICLNSVKTGQGTAIYTAECAHAFHFPCIAAHVGKHNTLICPVCNTTWKDVPMLSVHKNSVFKSPEHPEEVVVYQNIVKPKTEDKKMIDSSPRASKINRDHVQRQLKNKTAYDDDEPLLSPTSGGRIIPIPEAEENDDEDDEEEFQGFFVNSETSSIKSYRSDSEINQRELRGNVQARFLPESALISTCHGTETHVVALRVKAPPPPSSRGSSSSLLFQPSHRAPIDLVTVLDVSGSMSGAKLLMLKRAMRLVISSLTSADRLSIVAFSATAKRLLPLKRMTSSGQLAARKIIERLVCGQGTSVGEALRKATRVLEDRRDKNPVASIMLLSDGQDERVGNKGRNQRQEMRSNESSTRFAHIEIPVHEFGFGEHGRRYTNEPAEEAFAKCVGGLLSVVVQDIRIQLSLQSGSSRAEISAIYSANGRRPTVCSSGSVRLGDLYAEEDRELLVELKLASSAVDFHRMISVRCLYKDPSTQEVVYGKEQGLLIPRLQCSRTSAPKTERLRNLFITTRAVAESRRSIEHDDYTSAHRLLASARALLTQSSSISADEYIRALEAELAELQWRRQQIMTHRRRGSDRDTIGSLMEQNDEDLTPTSAWRAAERLAKVAMMKKSLTSRVSDLHGFENARF